MFWRSVLRASTEVSAAAVMVWVAVVVVVLVMAVVVSDGHSSCSLADGGNDDFVDVGSDNSIE